MLRWLRKRVETGRRAGELYGSVVTAARQPAFYGVVGVPDTPEGRFELVALHLYLALESVRDTAPDGDLRQRAIEAFVTDMDDCMREMGVGDLTVPKKVRRAAAAFYERATNYQRGLADVTNAALADILGRYVFAGGAGREDARAALARYLRAASAALAVEPFEAWVESGAAASPARNERFKHQANYRVKHQDSNDVTDTTLDWTEKTTEIPAGGLERTRDATPSELEQIAKTLDILGVSSLSARYRVVAISGGGYRLSGSIAADVVQACIVSLEPVSGSVRASFEVEFWPALKSEESEEEASVLSGTDVELLEHGLIPVGRIVFETLSASLDPYPRRDDAEFTWQDPKSDVLGATNPFAALSKLKDKG